MPSTARPPRYEADQPIFCRQCNGDLIQTLDGRCCGTCGLPEDELVTHPEQPHLAVIDREGLPVDEAQAREASKAAQRKAEKPALRRKEVQVESVPEKRSTRTREK